MLHPASQGQAEYISTTTGLGIGAYISGKYSSPHRRAFGQRDKVSQRLMITMLSTLIFTVTIALADVDPETAVGVWAFDEGAGKETKDISGLNHHGQLNGAKWKNGKFGPGLEFNGGQWVEVKSTPELQVGKQLTMMAWF